MVDFIIVGFATVMVLVAVFFPWFLANPFGFFSWLSFPFAMGLVYVVYFGVAESSYGCTVGKRLVGLRVVVLGGGRPSLERAFIRNISKVFWVLLVLDVVGGFFTVGDDPRQKFSDRIAGTTVV